MTDTVDILRYFQSKVVTGRRLDIKNIAEVIEGNTNFILIYRNRLIRGDRMHRKPEDMSGDENRFSYFKTLNREL